MSTKTIGRAVGALFLLAFVLYLAGSGLVGAGSGEDALSGVADHRTRISVGALLMLANSAVVVAIGVLALRVLKPHGELSAYGYLAGRVIEAVMLAVGILFLLLLVPLSREYASADDGSVFAALARVAREANLYSYQIGMISLGSAGLLFCRVLLRGGLVPASMAVWGLGGYALFLAGAVLEVVGYGVGVALSVPAGLFEVALGVLLLVKGFPGDRRPESSASPLNRPAEAVVQGA